jgi:hypothetical protein
VEPHHSSATHTHTHTHTQFYIRGVAVTDKNKTEPLVAFPHVHIYMYTNLQTHCNSYHVAVGYVYVSLTKAVNDDIFDLFKNKCLFSWVFPSHLFTELYPL